MTATELYAIALRLLARHANMTDDEWWHHPAAYTLDVDDYYSLTDIIGELADEFLARSNTYDRDNGVDSVALLDEITKPHLM